MVTLDELCAEADDSHIGIYEYDLYNKKAFAVKTEDGERAIVFDKTKIENNAEYKELMAEELGHQVCDALCFIDDYFNPLRKSNIRKAEYKAHSWSYQRLVPLNDLQDALRKEKDTYLVADVFGVTHDFLCKCINYYKRKGWNYGKF